MAFRATKQKVLNRGIPPDSFLQELIAWAEQRPTKSSPPTRMQTFIPTSSRYLALGRGFRIVAPPCWK